ncbi:hypothetical protein ACS4N0_12575 [Levilactobacillus zymae]|uniref:hypothetical protein n=1 Tax=Levilactobacillus zymae TaxID=267363 RepID=UPI003FCE77EC
MTTEASASASASATASQSEDVATAAAATLQLQNLMRTAVNTLGISAESLDLTTENGIMALSAAVKNELSTPKEYGDSKAYSTGYSDAKSDIESYIKEFYVASGSILNVATLTAAITAAGGLNGYMKKLGDGISAISNLLSAYEQNNDLQASDNYGASTWQGSSYRTGSVTSSSFKLPADGFAGLLGGTVSASTKDYNQGYADYARDVAKGLNAWITQIKTNADDASNADVFANAQTYKPADLSGDTSIGASGSAFDNTITSVLKSAVGADGKYATNVLNYTKITGIADDANSDVSDAVSNLKIFIKVIAPYLVNGIAHQALSDVRSIGGTIEDSDYTPSDLEKAMSLNSGMMSVMTDLLGLTKAQLSEPLMNGIYNAIKGNVQKSIEKSWAVGEGKALTGFLQNDSDNIYDGAKSAPSAYTSLSGYSETNPGNLLGSV